MYCYAFLHFNLLYYQVEMSSSLSGEITNTRANTKRNVRLFHVGRKGKFSHSSTKSILMAERASSFLGTNNIERFTNKLCRITLIQTRTDESSNISRISERNNQRQQHHRHQDWRRWYLCFVDVFPCQANNKSEPPLKPESFLRHYEAVTGAREIKEWKTLDSRAEGSNISRKKASTTTANNQGAGSEEIFRPRTGETIG